MTPANKGYFFYPLLKSDVDTRLRPPIVASSVRVQCDHFFVRVVDWRWSFCLIFFRSFLSSNGCAERTAHVAARVERNLGM